MKQCHDDEESNETKRNRTEIFELFIRKVNY